MKIAVVGSRVWKDKSFIFETLRQCFQENLIPKNSSEDSHWFISGGAIGVDSFGEILVDDWNERMVNSPYKLITKKIFIPEWEKYGKRAGFLRNELIVNESDKIIAFWDGISKGTKHTIDLAIKAKKPLDIYIRS